MALADIPPPRAIVMMGLAFIFVLIVTIPLYIVYFQRKKSAALTLAVAFTFWALGALSVFIGCLIHRILLQVDEGEIQYAGYGINFGYAFSALSNIFMVLFVSQVYSKFNLFNRTQKVIPLINAILNGITIGLIIDTITKSIETIDVEKKYNPDYPIGQTIYFLVWTLVAFLFLLIYSAKARIIATYRWEKVGFLLIVLSAVSGMLVYISFALDIVVQEAFPSAFIGGYTIFNILGWLFAIFMANLAYFGYLMPKRLRALFKEEVS